MSQNTTMTTPGTGSTIGRVLEAISSAYIQREQIRAGVPLGFYGNPNQADAYQQVTTGVNSDGSTLVQDELVSGVPNSNLLAGVGVLVAVGIIAYALTR